MFQPKLWKDGEFLKLWWGQGISELGSQVSALALPTVAILILSATPFQVGLLEALQFLAFPVLATSSPVGGAPRFTSPTLLAARGPQLEVDLWVGRSRPVQPEV